MVEGTAGQNLRNIADFLKNQDADLLLIQEIDIDSTRSYHVDERPYLTEAIGWMTYTFAQNYDSPFLAYPVTQPSGVARAGLMTFSEAPIVSAERVELPIESGLTKLLDLDRCYSRNRSHRRGSDRWRSNDLEFHDTDRKRNRI